jgi:hypothetical protein
MMKIKKIYYEKFKTCYSDSYGSVSIYKCREFCLSEAQNSPRGLQGQTRTSYCSRQKILRRQETENSPQASQKSNQKSNLLLKFNPHESSFIRRLTDSEDSDFFRNFPSHNIIFLLQEQLSGIIHKTIITLLYIIKIYYIMRINYLFILN